jgi:hypothetical protein
MLPWVTWMTTTTINTTSGYEGVARSRPAPRASGRVFLHTAAIEAARALVKEYDEAPCTSEDVAGIEAARKLHPRA